MQEQSEKIKKTFERETTKSVSHCQKKKN